MIAFQHVSLASTAPGARRLWVEDVSFCVGKGEVFGVAGQDGAGKATLLRMVNGLTAPTHGEVVVDGQKVARLGGRELTALRRRVGLCFASPALMAGAPVAATIALPLGASGMKEEQIASRVEELLHLTGIEGLGGSDPSALSLPQQKRADLARALALGPDILLCMEPTRGLMPAAAESMLALLEELHRSLGLTMLLSTTDLHVIKRLCGRAAIVKEGKVVELKDAYSLFSEPEHPFTREFLAQQLSFDPPPEVREHAMGAIVRIEYMGDSANEPVLYETVQRFGAEFNILHGHIEYIGGKPLGKMYVSFNAEPALMVAVLAYLKANTYRAEVVSDV